MLLMGFMFFELVPLVDTNYHKAPTSGPIHNVVSINTAFMQSSGLVLGLSAALECKEQEKMDTGD